MNRRAAFDRTVDGALPRPAGLRWTLPVRRKPRTAVTIGYPNHGKTVFLAGAFWDSFFALSESLEDARRPYAVRAINTRAGEVFFGNALALSRGELPPSTPRTPPEPATLEFSGIPTLRGGRSSLQVTFFDIPGELVSDEEWLMRNADFLPQVTDIIFIFDPTRADFAERSLQAADLSDRIARLIPHVGRRNYLVVLSKMDELRHEDDWAALLEDLWPDAPPRQADLGRYFHEMETLSRELRVWWGDAAHGGKGFVGRLPPSVRFCALSSLGHEPVWTCAGCSRDQPDRLRQCASCAAERQAGTALKLVGLPRPFRVRDPLFWIFRAAGVM